MKLSDLTRSVCSSVGLFKNIVAFEPCSRSSIVRIFFARLNPIVNTDVNINVVSIMARMANVFRMRFSFKERMLIRFTTVLLLFLSINITPVPLCRLQYVSCGLP